MEDSGIARRPLRPALPEAARRIDLTWAPPGAEVAWPGIGSLPWSAARTGGQGSSEGCVSPDRGGGAACRGVVDIGVGRPKNMGARTLPD